MATHSSKLAWEIPWTGEPGERQSMGSQRVGHAGAAEHTCRYLHSGLHSTTHPYIPPPTPASTPHPSHPQPHPKASTTTDECLSLRSLERSQDWSAAGQDSGGLGLETCLKES